MINQGCLDKNVSKVGCLKGINLNNRGQSPRTKEDNGTQP